MLEIRGSLNTNGDRLMKQYIHHIVLTVSDVKKSTDFYSKISDWQIREQAEHYTEFVPSDDPGGKHFLFVIGTPSDYHVTDNVFDRNRIGLDHFAFWVETEEELQAIEHRLRAEDIEMEDGGITNDDFGGTSDFLLRSGRNESRVPSCVIESDGFFDERSGLSTRVCYIED